MLKSMEMKPQQLLIETSMYVQKLSRCQDSGWHGEQSESTVLRRWFNLRKFTSNDVDLLKVIPYDLRNDGMKKKYLKLGNLTHDKALGVKWNVKDDTFGFII